MNAHKRTAHSALLNRAAHADVFELGAPPRFLFVLFGGSGIDEEEYERRGRSVIPVFDRVLAGLAVPAVFAHVTAPYDVPLNRFATEPAAAAVWNAHVLTELLVPWAGQPYFVCGFSGGAALALNGLQNEARCFGGAALGGDGIPADFVRPPHWAGPLRLYAAPDDRVCSHPAGRRVVERLVARGHAEEYRLSSGGHRLADYATAECLGELIRFADRTAPS